jgi:hypothetical protein
MSQKKQKSENKHTVKEVLKSLQWSVEDNVLMLLSSITDEFVTISMDAIMSRSDGEVEDSPVE